MKTVTLHGPKAAGRVALVDDEDYELVMAYRWGIVEAQHPNGRLPWGPYAVTSAGGKRLWMHSLLTGWPLTDHADHDGLNNQRYNLRKATIAENVRNQRPRPGTSSFKGVSWDRFAGKWHARIRFEYKCHHLGYFADEVEAARAYDAAARKYFGEFASPNFPG